MTRIHDKRESVYHPEDRDSDNGFPAEILDLRAPKAVPVGAGSHSANNT